MGDVNTYTFPWKNIGKDIGKKLRDVIKPPADSGPTREERKAQRLADALKGFTYLDNFDELAAWQSYDVHDSQRASIPVYQRTGQISSEDGQPQSRLLLCHDYQGGYHDYESNRPSLMKEPMYFCNYLQNVEVFIYFSHKLVSCPPPTWTNALHRNGVKVFGTFILEPGTHAIERIFEKAGDSHVIAEQLAAIADHLGFDGWLLNIEKHFSIFTEDPTGKLIDFIQNLRDLMGPQKQLIWYDALTHNNEVDYQNCLSSQNWRFAKAAGMLFTNYAWDESHLAKADATVQWYGLQKSDIFFGIDMWAQNTNMPGPKRITYPEEGGGGTMTGFAANKLAESGYATAVLAPAWTCEHFPSSVSSRVDEAVWQGTDLPADLQCDCRKGKPHHTSAYSSHPLAYSAEESFAGTSHFFESDFRVPFERASESHAGDLLRSRLGSMHPQVCLDHTSAWADALDVLRRFRLRTRSVSTKSDLTRGTSSHLEVLLEQDSAACIADNLLSAKSETELHRLPIFRLKMLLDRPLEATVLCKDLGSAPITAGVYFCYRSEDGQKTFKDLPVEESCGKKQLNVPCQAMSNATGSANYLTEFGVYCAGPVEEVGSFSCMPLFKLHHLAIGERIGLPIKGELTNVRTEKRGHADHETLFLVWKWTHTSENWPAGRPLSQLTGPFERFEVEIEGNFLGEAFCSEFCLRDTDLAGIGENFHAAIGGKVFGEAHVVRLWQGNIDLMR